MRGISVGRATLIVGVAAALALSLGLALGGLGRPAPAQTVALAQPSPFDTTANQIVAEITSGQWADVRARFDPTMTAQLSEVQLADAWRTFQELLGDYQSAAPPTSVMRGDLTVEQVPVSLANGAGEIRITFHPDGTIAGLFFLRPGVPVP